MTTCCYVRAGGICSTEWQWQDELASALWCWVLDNELGWRHQSRYSNGRYRHAERDVTVTSRRCAHIPPHTEPLWSMTHIALSLKQCTNFTGFGRMSSRHINCKFYHKFTKSPIVMNFLPGIAASLERRIDNKFIRCFYLAFSLPWFNPHMLNELRRLLSAQHLRCHLFFYQ